jgi:glycosyltransferase involved in cell wall biosynthesis
MSHESPVISVAMPVYNCADVVDIAIRSILNQTFSNWELLVIDDGSTDGTLEMARAFADPRIRVVADGLHKGLVGRLNQGIGLSRGRYFARMDGDDVSYPDRFALQVEHLERHPEIDLLGGGVLVFGRGGKALGTREIRVTHEEICQKPWTGFYLPHPTWLGRTPWFREHLYRSEAVRCEDQELLLRTYEISRFAALPRIVLGYQEEDLPLRKILKGRRSFACAAIRHAIRRSRLAFAVAAGVSHAVKGMAESVAISTGLKHRALRHRARPVSESERLRWNNVWNQVQDKDYHVHASPLEAIEA